MGAKRKKKAAVALRPVLHGIGQSFYANSGFGDLWPIHVCLCGHSVGRGNATWAETGADLDAHIEEATKESRDA
jgi:hypothetical protein